MADSEVNSLASRIKSLQNYHYIDDWTFFWQVLKKLKDIPFKIQTASLKERREVVEEIRNLLSTPGKYYREPLLSIPCGTIAIEVHWLHIGA